MGDFEELRELSVRAGTRVTLVRQRSDGRLMIRKELALAEGTEPAWGHPWFASPSNGLVPVLDWGRLPEGRGWLTMPCADGMDGAPADGDPIAYTPASLQFRMREEGPLTLTEVERLARSIAGTLRALHERGLVHRDVKPSNILFFEGQPRMADLDLVGPPGHVPEHYGTQGYMPMLGNEDQAGDLFALGRTLYELWTGNDRFEFPSLPPELIRSEDWDQRCVAFNQLLNCLCPADPRRQKIRTAGDLLKALDGLDQGSEPRRKHMAAALRWVASLLTR